ncbi:MAG TPA: rhomboid family intramembrane serine protease [Nitriliruptoraceae bacterium]|nr:rhomboid family intramembrane serine protease [Nitriliruptoraceae bacterium]
MSNAQDVASGRVCYRHPDRPAPLACTRCGRPICLDDAIDAPVGFLCPEDAQVPKRQQQAARSVARMDRPLATSWLLGLVVVAYLGQQFGLVTIREWALFGPAVAAGEWYRVLTSGFLHINLLHIAFNGYLLYQLGRMLENPLGSSRLVAVYLAGLFGGSAGALLLSYDAVTIGASGAVFGLMGAAMVGLRKVGVNPWTSQIGGLVIINLVFTFVISNVSVGGHLGGLVAGAVAGWAAFRVERGDPTGHLTWVVTAAMLALAIGVGVVGWSLGLGL